MKKGTLKNIAAIIGVFAAIAGAFVVLSKVFKKYFTIEIECGDCENCENPCVVAEDSSSEPECVEAEEEKDEEGKNENEA